MVGFIITAAVTRAHLAATGSPGWEHLGKVLPSSLTTSLPSASAPCSVSVRSLLQLTFPTGEAGGDQATCLRALVCEWRDWGPPRKGGGCGQHTSASSLSVSSSTFTVRMKARCARTWRSASRRYFLQAHRMAREDSRASGPHSTAGWWSEPLLVLRTPPDPSVSPLPIGLGSAPQKPAPDIRWAGPGSVRAVRLWLLSHKPVSGVPQAPAKGLSPAPGLGQVNEAAGRGSTAGMEGGQLPVQLAA